MKTTRITMDAGATFDCHGRQYSGRPRFGTPDPYDNQAPQFQADTYPLFAFTGSPQNAWVDTASALRAAASLDTIAASTLAPQGRRAAVVSPALPNSTPRNKRARSVSVGEEAGSNDEPAPQRPRVDTPASSLTQSCPAFDRRRSAMWRADPEEPHRCCGLQNAYHLSGCNGKEDASNPMYLKSGAGSTYFETVSSEDEDFSDEDCSDEEEIESEDEGGSSDTLSDDTAVNAVDALEQAHRQPS